MISDVPRHKHLSPPFKHPVTVFQTNIIEWQDKEECLVKEENTMQV